MNKTLTLNEYEEYRKIVEATEETPVFTHVLDLWLYCKERNKDFKRRKQVSFHQWTLAAEKEINSDS